MVIEERKPTLGIPEGLYLQCASAEGLAHFEKICELLITNYQIRRVRVMDDFQIVRDRHDAIMSFDAANVHEEWFAKHENLYSQKFTDLIHRGQNIFDRQSLLEARDRFRESITQTMNENQIDVSGRARRRIAFCDSRGRANGRSWCGNEDLGIDNRERPRVVWLVGRHFMLPRSRFSENAESRGIVIEKTKTMQNTYS